MDFVLKLSEVHAQVVLDALAQQPYYQVAETIEVIQQQAVEQRQANQGAQEKVQM